MKHFQLAKDEVVLYQNEVLVTHVGEEEKESKRKKTETEFALTNHKFVFIVKTKRLLFGEKVEVEELLFDQVKVYNDLPYIVREEDTIAVYFTEQEKRIHFANKKEAKSFFELALKTVSGHSKFIRGIRKAQKGIDNTSEALGVDIRGVAKEAAAVAVTVVASGKGKIVKAIAKAAMDRKEKKALNAAVKEDDFDKLERLKLLLDEGAITQEEFEKMKKEILHL